MRFILLLALGFVLRGEGWRFEVTTVKTALGRSLRRIFGGVVLAGGLSTAGGLMFAPLEPVHAADWSDRNRLAAETWRTVDESYVDRTFNGMDWFKLRQGVVKREYKTDEAVYAAIRDMLANLGDPYTRYLPPAQYTALINSAVGELTGVGLELTTNAEDGSVRVVNVADGSPAIGSGILPGDVLVNVDGTPTAGLSAEEVAALIRGKQNTKASLRLSRASREGGPTTESDYVVVRQSFKLKGVGWERVKIKGGKDVGLVTVKSFSGTTRDDILKALVSFHAGGDGVDAIVLDMRNNGGGLLQGAVETANLLLPPGKVVVFTVAKDGKQEVQQTLPGEIPSNDPSLPDLTTPLYVLVNKNSASATEVLAGALKDNKRATIVGEKTFGKGIIQNVQELRQGGVAITVAKYETPLHNNINKVGISPDVAVACASGANVVEECLPKFIQ